MRGCVLLSACLCRPGADRACGGPELRGGRSDLYLFRRMAARGVGQCPVRLGYLGP